MDAKHTSFSISEKYGTYNFKQQGDIYLSGIKKTSEVYPILPWFSWL